jgi:hypothetical protein
MLVVDVQPIRATTANTTMVVTVKNGKAIAHPLTRTTPRALGNEVRIVLTNHVFFLPLTIAVKATERTTILRPISHVRLAFKYLATLNAHQLHACRLRQVAAMA